MSRALEAARVRDATADDVMAVLAIHGECLEITRRIYHPVPAGLEARDGVAREGLPDPRGSMQLVLDVGDQLVGAVSCEFIHDRLHLQSLQVLPAWHRRGVARRLVLEAAVRARAGGARCLSLETIRQTGNVEIFERLGFRIVRAEVTERFALRAGGAAALVYLERGPCARSAGPDDPLSTA